MSDIKVVQVTFSFHLSYDLLFHKTVSTPSLKTQDVDIRIEEKYHNIPSESGIIGTYRTERKSIVHVSIERSLDSIKTAPVDIFEEAFNALISFLQLFRMRTRNFRVNPSKMRTSLAAKHGDLYSATYNPREIEDIKVSYEADDGIEYPLQDIFSNPIIVAAPVISGTGTRVCDESKWQDICQEFETTSPDGLSYSEYELLANELLTEAYGLIASEFPIYFVADPFDKSESPGPRMCAAIISIAVACEVYVKGYILKHGQSIYRNFLDNHREFTMPVKDYLDFAIKDIDGVSLKDVCSNLWSNIALLFEIRNKIVHLGKAVVKSRSGKTEYLMIHRYVDKLGRCVEELIDWLESPDKCTFPFKNDSDLREEIRLREEKKVQDSKEVAEKCKGRD